MRPLTLPSGIFVSRTRGAGSSTRAGRLYVRQTPASSTAIRRFIGTLPRSDPTLLSVIIPQEAGERRVDAVEAERNLVSRDPDLVTSGSVAGVFRDAQLIAADLPFAHVLSPDIPADHRAVLREVIRPVHPIRNFLADHLETDVLARETRKLLLVRQGVTRLARDQKE